MVDAPPIQSWDLLRPIERRILLMRSHGLPVDEIARRVRRSPDHVERMIAWASLPRSKRSDGLAARAIQHRVLALRFAGESHEQIGARFRRSARHIRQVEGLAHYRLGLELLAPV